MLQKCVSPEAVSTAFIHPLSILLLSLPFPVVKPWVPLGLQPSMHTAQAL
jgi:hypothetical protein